MPPKRPPLSDKAKRSITNPLLTIFTEMLLPSIALLLVFFTPNSSAQTERHTQNLVCETTCVDVQKSMSYLQNLTIATYQKVQEIELHMAYLRNATSILEQKLECVAHPCLNGGKCSVINNERRCECSPGFEGEKCETYRHKSVNLRRCAFGSRNSNGQCNRYVTNEVDTKKCEPGKDLNENATLIFGSSQGIDQLSLSQPTVALIQEHHPDKRALDFLYRTKTMFWGGDNGVMYTAPVRCEGPKTVLTEPGSFILCLAVDWIYNHIYYADHVKNEFIVTNLDGTMKKVLFTTGITDTHAIVVNPLSGWIYWVNWDTKYIERAGLDGSGREVITKTSPNRSLGLALDMTQNRLYWTTSAHPCSIYSMNPDGSDQKLVYTATEPTFSNSEFRSVTTLGDFVYWRDHKTKGMYKTSKWGGEDATMIYSHTGNNALYTLQAYHSSKQPEGVNYCENRIGGQCSHLCFPTPSNESVSMGTKCACPDGRKLSSNQLTCT